MNLHAGHTAIGHVPVARVVRAAKDARHLPEQPAPALVVAEVEQQVVRVERESAADLEDAGRLGKCTLASPRCADHPQRAEHRDGIVERAIREALQPAEVEPDRVHLQFRQLSAASDLDEHRLGKLDRDYAEPTPCKPDRVPPGAASEVNHAARLPEPGINLQGVALEEGVVEEIVIFLLDQSRRVGVSSERGVHANGQSPGRGSRRSWIDLRREDPARPWGQFHVPELARSQCQRLLRPQLRQPSFIAESTRQVKVNPPRGPG